MPAPGGDPGGQRDQAGLPGRRAGCDAAMNGGNYIVVGSGWLWARRRNRLQGGPGHRGSSLKDHEGRNHTCERRCGHCQCPEPRGGRLGFGMTGCCGHHAPVREAPRSPGEVTPADVRWLGQRLSAGNLLDSGYDVRENPGIKT